MTTALSWDPETTKETLKRKIYSKNTPYGLGNCIIDEIEGLDPQTYIFSVKKYYPVCLPFVKCIETEDHYKLSIRDKNYASFDNFLKSVIITWLTYNDLEELSKETDIPEKTITDYINNIRPLSHQQGTELECFIYDNLTTSYERLFRAENN